MVPLSVPSDFHSPLSAAKNSPWEVESRELGLDPELAKLLVKFVAVLGVPSVENQSIVVLGRKNKCELVAKKPTTDG